MKRTSDLRRVIALIFIPAYLLSPNIAHCQAAPTAGRAFEISVFAEYARLHPDYGTAINGLSVGLDVSHPIRYHFVVPSLELRANYAAEGPAVGEQVALGGLRLDFRVDRAPRLTPYVNFLLGAGQIDFRNSTAGPLGIYSRDNSIVYNYGAGVDYEVAHNFAVQLEFQHQNWNLGSINSTLTPSSFNAGVRYRIPPLRRRY